MSKYSEIEQCLGYKFNSPLLLESAITHKSHPDGENNNERLEYLGDALLGMLLAEKLLADHPLASEGDLTKMRSWLVRGTTLSQIGESVGLRKLIRLGAGEKRNLLRGEKNAIIEDAFEALVGAIYLDGGFKSTQKAVLNLYGPRLSWLWISRNSVENPKNGLNQYCQRSGFEPPSYQLITKKSVDPLLKTCFTIQATAQIQPFSKRVRSMGSGSTQTEAENEAAQGLLKRIEKALSLYETLPAQSDPKTRLQEYCQSVHRGRPCYDLYSVLGTPPKQTFLVICRLDGEAPMEAKGSGSSKKRAEQAAAAELLKTISLKNN